MPELYLAVDDELAGRMFDVQSDFYTFAPGFISDAPFVPFKDTIDWAIEAATRACSSKAKQVIHSDTVWKVLKFHITFDQIGRLTHASCIKRVPRGYKVYTTLEKYPNVLSVRWPRRTPYKWLVTRGFKIHQNAAVGEACSCQHPHSTLYKVAAGKFLCETCLIAQEQATTPASSSAEQPTSIAPVAAVSPTEIVAPSE